MVILPNAADCIQVVLSGTNQGTGWQNKLHLQKTLGSTVDAGMLTSVCNSVITAWTTDIAPLCNLLVALTNVQAIDLSSRTAAIAKVTPGTPVAGTRSGTAMTVQNALTSSWVAQLRYRGGHPRNYWPAGVLADTSSGHLWQQSFQTLAQTNFNAFRLALNSIVTGAVTYDLILLSYYSGSHKVPGQPPPAPVLRPTPLPLPITGVAVHPRIDTQRRRLGKETP